MIALEQTVPEGYKQTLAGIIPEDWEVTTLEQAANFLDGLRRPVKSGERAKIKGQYPYYGASGIVDYVNDYIFDGDFILLGEDGENILSRNLPLAFKASGKIWVNNHAHVMTPKDEFHIDYLVEYLESLDYSLLNSGTAQPKLNKQACLSINVVKPLKEEQTAIGNALSGVDALLTELEKLIAKKQAIKTAIMQQLLTGKTRLPQFATHTEDEKKGQPKGTKPSELGEIPEDWDVVNLGEIISFKNGAAHEDCIDEYGDFVLVNSKFVSTEGRVRKGANECRQPACKDDLLMVMSDVPNGKAIAKCFIVDQDNLYTVNQRICIIKPLDEMNPIFLLKVLSRNPYYLAFDDGAKQTNLRREDVLSCPLVKPPKLEQAAIATVLSDMDHEIQTLEQRLAKTRQIKQGMMQELLTGRTRLPFDKEK